MTTGVITLTDGGYLLEKVKPGNYFIRVSFVGFKTNGKRVVVEPGMTEIEVDTIFLAETTASLSEVTVMGERLKGKEMVDRTVYAIPSVVSKSTSNGYDLLKKIPQVNVDFQNNVTLNGSTNFIIQVDGRQRDKEYLARLLPTDIETIEIISNPSGKYEGQYRRGAEHHPERKRPGTELTAISASTLSHSTRSPARKQEASIYALGKITFYVTALDVAQSLNINNTN